MNSPESKQSSERPTIYLNSIGSPVLGGRENGEAERRRIVSQLRDGAILVAPSEVVFISSGYLIGLLGESVREMGEARFRERFSIYPSSDAILDDVIEESLRTPAKRGDMELTKEEEDAIRSLKRVAKKWPKSLMLFAGGTSLSIRKVPKGEFPGAQWDIGFIEGIPYEGGDTY